MNLDKIALLLVDIQNDYFPGGKMELEGSVEASFAAKRTLDHFRRLRKPVVHIQHVSTRPGATFFLPGTPGVEIHENVRPAEGEPVFQKSFPNSFRETPLLNYLREQGAERLVICGMMTHMCIDATTRAAFDFGFECAVVGEACATRQLALGEEVVPAKHVHLAFLAALGAVYAKLVTAADVAAE